MTDFAFAVGLVVIVVSWVAWQGYRFAKTIGGIVRGGVQ